MIYVEIVAVVELVLIVALVVALYCVMWTADRGRERAEAAWREERSELLERIQRPERPPGRALRAVSERKREEPPDLSAYSQVGTVQTPSAEQLRDEGDVAR